MSRKFDKFGFNTQFKWQPIRRDRWDPFPKDHLPFIDDMSFTKQAHMPPRRNFTPVEAPSTPDPVNNLMPDQGTPGGYPEWMRNNPGGMQLPRRFPH
jgi:hypothetical protein